MRRAVVSSIKPADPDRSTVVDEVDAMDWDFSELAKLLTQLEEQPSLSSRQFIVKEARRRLDTLVQRAYRAKQIARGLRVTKAN